jgi:TonB system transport protein ExbD (group 1)
VSIKLSEDQIDFKRHSYPPNADMNVTPFVDVMLVLLIIFMVAAPLATVTIPVELPRSTAAPTPPPATPVNVTLQADGALFVNNDRTDLDHLADAVRGAAGQRLDARILVRGDRHIEYGQLIEVMDRLANNGFSTVGLVTDLGEKP